MTRGRILALGTAVVVALFAALGATATPPGRNGLIVYAQELRPEHYQLFTIRPDGSGAKQITHVVNAANPDWSPNGKTIVAEVESKSGAGITLLSPTGSVIRNLTPTGYPGTALLFAGRQVDRVRARHRSRQQRRLVDALKRHRPAPSHEESLRGR